MFYFDDLLRMSIATKCHFLIYLAIFGQDFLNVNPEFASGTSQETNVAQDEESVTGASKSDADSIGSTQESHRFALVVTYQRQNDHGVMSTVMM